MNEYLVLREQKQFIIDELLTFYPIVFSIKANIPGNQKQIKEAYFLVSLFSNLLKHLYHPLIELPNDSMDGPYTLMGLSKTDPISIKNEIILLENQHPLGRFIDIDIFDSNQKGSKRRSDLGLEIRTCYLCLEPVYQCSRNQTHPTIELIHFIEENVSSYIRHHLYEALFYAINKELAMEDKFGLVTLSSQGSHPDMNAQIMETARDAILPYFIDLFMLSFHEENMDFLFEKARLIAIESEKKMMQATHGINCYKGLIYVLGFFMLAIGQIFRSQKKWSELFQIVTHLAKDVKKDFNNQHATAGIKLYHQYGFLGVRGEAYLGFPSIEKILPDLSDDFDLLRDNLKKIILMTEDSVFLKRAGSLAFYHAIKNEFEKTDVKDPNEAKKWTEYCIFHHLSFGGSADLLITALFLKKLESSLFKPQAPK